MASTTIIRPRRQIPPDDSLTGSQQAFAPLGVIEPDDTAGWAQPTPLTIGSGVSTRIGIVNAVGYRTFSLPLTMALAGNSATIQYSMVNPKSPPNEMIGRIAIATMIEGSFVYTWGQSGGAWPLFHFMSIWIAAGGGAAIQVTAWGPLYASSP